MIKPSQVGSKALCIHSNSASDLPWGGSWAGRGGERWEVGLTQLTLPRRAPGGTCSIGQYIQWLYPWL